MPFPDLTRLISSLHARGQRLRDESEKRLVQAICSGAGITFSVICGWLCMLHWNSLLALNAGAMLASFIFLPGSLLIASFIWNRILASWVVSGDIFQRLRYLEYQYFNDLDRIKKLRIPESEKRGLETQRYKVFVEETAPLRESIKNLTEPSQRNLLRKKRLRSH